MVIRKIWVLLIFVSALAGCTSRKDVVVAQEYNFIAQDKLRVLREDFEKNIGNKVYFAFDSSALSEDAKHRLEKQAEWLTTHPFKATIEGHCDDRGSREYNNGLGLRRAEAVRKFLASHGVDKNRLEVVSYGKDRPEAQGHNADARRLNRRVVTITIDAI